MKPINDVYSPLRPAAWCNMLCYDEMWDEDALFILDGVYNGFAVVDKDADISTYCCSNYNSCFKDDNYNKMSSILKSELDSDKLSFAAASPHQVHALGAVPKPNGAVRHITDCSRPALSSVNNYMKETFSRFSFQTIDDVIKQISPNCFMATIDLQDAYRSVPIHPDNRKHFGLQWDFGEGPAFMTDNFLCFGSKCSAYIFNRLTDAVTRYIHRLGHKCFNYLDDFIIIADSFAEACKIQNLLISTLRCLGFYISWKKVFSPSQFCRYLGIDIDSVNQRLILPDDKIKKLNSELNFWQDRRTATKFQMQRLCGVLNFCCKVVRGGRVFMFHMIQLLKCFNLKSRIELPKSFHEDITWWLSFAETFNGCADFFDPVDRSVELYTDACLNGLAGVCDSDFYQAKVIPVTDATPSFITLSAHHYEARVPYYHAANINVLDLIAVLLAFIRWNVKFENTRVISYCDNLQVCYNLAKDKTKNCLSNYCLRQIFWMCASINSYISPVYIPSKYNVDADYLSRLPVY